MSVRLEWKGLDDLRAQLRALPGDLRAKADDAVRTAADQTLQRAFAGFPRASGFLGDSGVVLPVSHRSGVTGAAVVFTANYAAAVEGGSRPRATRQGWKRGMVLGAHVFVPIAKAERSSMYATLTGLLKEHGFRVSGEV